MKRSLSALFLIVLWLTICAFGGRGISGSGGGVSTSAEVVGVFGSGSCSGYLKSDGTCDTPATGVQAGAYDADTWNGNTNAPTKDAVRDKYESQPAYTEPGANGPLCRTGAGKVGACTSVKDVAPFFSFVIAAPAATDDINIFKAPYAITITSIACIVQGTTSVTGQLQECDANGANCADLDTGSDIVCDADGAADDGTLADNAIAANAWVRWKTTSVTDTPTFLTVTVKYTP